MVSNSLTVGNQPPLTLSSEHSKVSEKAIAERHLSGKRFNETKCYLRYVRSSHPFICNLEAFFDIRAFGEEIISYAHIYEYCDWGTLENIVEQYYEEPRWGHRVPEAFGPNLKKGHRVYKHAAIPEAFIWHVYSQSMEALSFLHGDHELNKKPEFHRHNQIIMLDIKLDNIFLKDSGRPNTYQM